MSGEQYDADYFLRGKQTSKSLYENYRWLPELTKPMVAAMIAHLGIKKTDIILDFGCARGYTVRALQEFGYNAWGYDISQWALENADEKVKEYLVTNNSTMWCESFDWIITKDVLEHVEDLCSEIDAILDMAKVGVFAIVPLSHDGKRYDVPEYEEDVTHIHRRPLQWWVGYFHRAGWSVEARYLVTGIKENYAHFPTGNGFITCRRLQS
jgi:cyclopropane fatty-acyl-phospholipid synthase-like methyltransferase